MCPTSSKSIFFLRYPKRNYIIILINIPHPYQHTDTFKYTTAKNRRGLPNGLRHTKSRNARRRKPHILLLLLAVPTICRTPGDTRAKIRRSAHHPRNPTYSLHFIHSYHTHIPNKFIPYAHNKVHTYIYIHIYTHIHIHIHTHTYTHICMHIIGEFCLSSESKKKTRWSHTGRFRH